MVCFSSFFLNAACLPLWESESDSQELLSLLENLGMLNKGVYPRRLFTDERCEIQGEEEEVARVRCQVSA